LSNSTPASLGTTIASATVAKIPAALTKNASTSGKKELVNKKVLEAVVDFVPRCSSILNSIVVLDKNFLFKEPVNTEDLPDYAHRIDNPMDFSTLQTMLMNRTIDSPNRFALYCRRIFANCLRYNYQLGGEFVTGVKSIRAQAELVLFGFEELWASQFPTGNQVCNASTNLDLCLFFNF
jgi:hypothetical protein